MPMERTFGQRILKTDIANAYHIMKLGMSKIYSIMPQRPATQKEIESSQEYLIGETEIAIDNENAVLKKNFPVKNVSYWAVTPEDRHKRNNLWCTPECNNGSALISHYCPEGPMLLPFPDQHKDGDGVVVAHYAYKMLQGEEFPPIVIVDAGSHIEDPVDRWLVMDGFHRISACKTIGDKTIPAIIFSTKRRTR